MSEPPSDLKVIREHHAAIWQQIKESRGFRSPNGGPVEKAIPEFRASVQALLEQGYTMSEVGLIFGMGHSRIGQLCQRWELEVDRAAAVRVRVFDWQNGKFVPMVFARVKRQAKADARRITIERELQARIAKTKAHLLAFAADSGKPPIMKELARALGFKGQLNHAVYALFSCRYIRLSSGQVSGWRAQA